MKPKNHDHPKPVKYPEPKEPVLPYTPFELRVDLAESIYAHAVGAWIRDTCHRPSIPDVEFERIAKMAVHAAELFRKTESNSCEHKDTKIWEPHLAGARKCLDCGMVYNPNHNPRWFME